MSKWLIFFLYCPRLMWCEEADQLPSQGSLGYYQKTVLERYILDKKMRKEVTKPIRKAEKILKKAEKNNVKLANYDEKVRDPLVAKVKKMKKGC